MKFPTYPSGDLLHLKGGKHSVTSVVVGTTAKLALPAEAERATVIIHPVTNAVDILDSNQATEGFPIAADTPIALPTKKDIWLKAAADTTVWLLVIHADQ